MYLMHNLDVALLGHPPLATPCLNITKFPSLKELRTTSRPTLIVSDLYGVVRTDYIASLNPVDSFTKGKSAETKEGGSYYQV